MKNEEPRMRTAGRGRANGESGFSVEHDGETNGKKEEASGRARPKTPKGRAPPVASVRFVREVNRQKARGAIGHASDTKRGSYAETQRNAKEM